MKILFKYLLQLEMYLKTVEFVHSIRSSDIDIFLTVGEEVRAQQDS